MCLAERLRERKEQQKERIAGESSGSQGHVTCLQQRSKLPPTVPLPTMENKIGAKSDRLILNSLIILLIYPSSSKRTTEELVPFTVILWKKRIQLWWPVPPPKLIKAPQVAVSVKMYSQAVWAVLERDPQIHSMLFLSWSHASPYSPHTYIRVAFPT